MSDSLTPPPEPNSQPSVTELIESARSAIRDHNRLEARHLLTQAVTLDQNSESAWLWLSRTVDSLNDRVTCLENVLTLNPDNQEARTELATVQNEIRMRASTIPTEPVDTIELFDNTPMAHERMVDRSKKRLRQRPPTDNSKGKSSKHTSHVAGFISRSTFDDVWSRAENIDMCAYCAHEVSADTSRCPNCKRSLAAKYYRYEKPSTHFHVFWMAIAALVQLFLIQTIVDAMSGQSTVTLLWHATFIPVFGILALFVYLRRFWAYIAAMIALFIAAVFISGESFLPELLDRFMGAAALTPIRGLYQGLFRFLTIGVRSLELVTIAIALFYGAFLAGPDFSRETVRLLARLDRKIASGGAAGAHLQADRYAKQKLWASAILYWQRAVVKDPGRLLYYLNLASAFETLGFYERALDVLTSAEKITTTPNATAQIGAMRVRVEAAQNKNAATGK